MISFKSTFQPNKLSPASCVLAGQKLDPSTPVVQIKDSVGDSVGIHEFDMRHLKKAERHTGRNIMSIKLKMLSMVRLVYVITLFKLVIRNLDKKFHRYICPQFGTSRPRHWPPCQYTQNGIYVL